MNRTEIDVFKIMADCGWDAIWYLSPESCGPVAVREGRAKETFFVGIWTGPQTDLICLKCCDTNAEADLWLSPSGETLESAIVHARLQLAKLKKLMPKTYERSRRGEVLAAELKGLDRREATYTHRKCKTTVAMGALLAEHYIDEGIGIHRINQ